MNVVFDLGRVLLHWDPRRISAAATEIEDERRQLHLGLFDHADWLELDRGTRSLGDVVARAAKRTGLNANMIDDVLKRVPPSLRPRSDVFAIAHSLAQHGHSLYVLSNMHKQSVQYLRQNVVLRELFDKEIYSCEVGMIKPEAGIFSLLLERCGIEAAATLFIDDMPDNIKAAQQMGINAIQFRNAGQLEKRLDELGCFESS